MANNMKVQNDSYVDPETGEDVPITTPEDDLGPGWETASAIIWRPVLGDVLMGVYGGNEPFTEGTLDTEVSKHFITTADGCQYSFVGGQVFDKAIAKAKIAPGYQIRVKYMGQTECNAGRVNLFDIKFKKN